MENLLGITGKDFTIIAASKAAMRGATILKAQDDKTRQLSDHCTMAFVGEAGDTIQFAEYIQANVALYSMRNAYTLPPQNIAAYTRNELASSLRSRDAYMVNLLIGGVDISGMQTANGQKGSPATSSPSSGPTTAAAGTAPAVITPATSSEDSSPSRPAGDGSAAGKVVPKLFWIDYLGSCTPVPYAAHGYAQYYCLSILDKHHHPDINLETGMKLLRMCSEELRRRLPIDFKGLFVKVVTAEGVKSVEFEDDANIRSA